MSYVKTDRIPEARSLIHDGIRRNGRFAGVYRQLLAQLPPPAALLRDSD